MPESNISLWLRFAQQQIAAESYLHDININDPAAVAAALVRGNNRQGFPEGGLTRLTQIQAQQFTQRYQIVDHHANDATGFSATLRRTSTLDSTPSRSAALNTRIKHRVVIGNEMGKVERREKSQAQGLRWVSWSVWSGITKN